jgi:hypothetical protein
MEHPKKPDAGDFVEPEEAPDYWTDERLKRARPIDFPEGPPKGPPPTETGDDGRRTLREGEELEH